MLLAALTWVIIISSSFVFLLYNYKRAFDFNLLLSQTLNSRKMGQNERDKVAVSQFPKAVKWNWVWNWKNSQSLPSNTHISSYLSCSAVPYSSLLPGMLVLHPPALPRVWFYSTFQANEWNKDVSFRFSAVHFNAHPDHLKKPKPLIQNVPFFLNSFKEGQNIPQSEVCALVCCTPAKFI